MDFSLQRYAGWNPCLCMNSVDVSRSLLSDRPKVSLGFFPTGNVGPNNCPSNSNHSCSGRDRCGKNRLLLSAINLVCSDLTTVDILATTFVWLRRKFPAGSRLWTSTTPFILPPVNLDQLKSITSWRAPAPLINHNLISSRSRRKDSDHPVSTTMVGRFWPCGRIQ